jgi:hypothetical protein
MPKTAAQRQAIYRARRPFAGTDGNGERRLNLWISTHVDLALERLARHYSVTKRELIERLVTAEEERILSVIILDSPEWNNYRQIVSVTQ